MLERFTALKMALRMVQSCLLLRSELPRHARVMDFYEQLFHAETNVSGQDRLTSSFMVSASILSCSVRYIGRPSQ